MPSSTRPLAKQVPATASTAATASAVPTIEVGSSRPNGRVPITTSAANAQLHTTASNELRPSLLQ